MSEKHLSETRFSELNLMPELLQAITDAGFNHCTPIQAQALPKALNGENIIGQARTGTGKTATFLIAVLNQLLTNAPRDGHRNGNPRALILAPTRELAVQIYDDALTLSKTSNLRVGVAYGGTDYEKQRMAIQAGVDILIGTPGRIIDYFKQHVFDLKGIQALVLDEADRMFDLGFIKDIRFLMRRMPSPQERLNLMFSATLSYRVTELAYEHMSAPEIVKAEEASSQVTAEKIIQTVYYVANDEKIRLLIGIFQAHSPERSIIFINTKHDAEKVCNYLKGNDIDARVLSGDVPQRKRQNLVLAFQKGEFPALVATDVAARGLHIPEVSHVINYDLPQDPEDYVHRIGRTGRIGAEGRAISFACESLAFYLPDIEEYIGQKLPTETVSEDLLVEPKPPVKSTSNANRNQQRPRNKPDGNNNANKRRRPRQNKPANKSSNAKPS